MQSVDHIEVNALPVTPTITPERRKYLENMIHGGLTALVELCHGQAKDIGCPATCL